MNVRSPADDIADGEKYLQWADEIEELVFELKRAYKSNPSNSLYYDIRHWQMIQREHRKTALHLLRRSERRKQENTMKGDK